MPVRAAFVITIVACLVVFSAVGQPQAAGSERNAGTATRPATPVIVELFTSEGCSSCPPADALLVHLEKAQPVPGAEVIALGLHVDYWDHLGWTDRFSSSQFTARQQEYAQFFRSNTVYTPQMVVDGQSEFVGSDQGEAYAAIARAAHAPKAVVTLQRSAQANDNPSEVLLHVRIEPLPTASRNDTADVLLAITESGLSSDVLRGENTGRKLSHTGVVRRLDVIGTADVKKAPVFSAETPVKIQSGWKRENLRVVVFVQERQSRRILAVGTIPL